MSHSITAVRHHPPLAATPAKRPPSSSLRRRAALLGPGDQHHPSAAELSAPPAERLESLRPTPCRPCTDEGRADSAGLPAAHHGEAHASCAHIARGSDPRASPRPPRRSSLSPPGKPSRELRRPPPRPRHLAIAVEAWQSAQPRSSSADSVRRPAARPIRDLKCGRLERRLISAFSLGASARKRSPGVERPRHRRSPLRALRGSRRSARARTGRLVDLLSVPAVRARRLSMSTVVSWLRRA